MTTLLSSPTLLTEGQLSAPCHTGGFPEAASFNLLMVAQGEGHLSSLSIGGNHSSEKLFNSQKAACLMTYDSSSFQTFGVLGRPLLHINAV